MNQSDASRLLWLIDATIWADRDRATLGLAARGKYHEDREYISYTAAVEKAVKTKRELEVFILGLVDK